MKQPLPQGWNIICALHDEVRTKRAAMEAGSLIIPEWMSDEVQAAHDLNIFAMNKARWNVDTMNLMNILANLRTPEETGRYTVRSARERINPA